MLSEESGEVVQTSNLSFELPEEVLQVLPQDPFEQLDIARKITSIALSTRVSSLESELSILQQSLTERDAIISDLQSHVESLDASLSHSAHKLSLAQQEKERLMKENASLTSTVRKLNRDVTKLESFRKTLMRSLKDEDDIPANNAAADGLISQSQTEDDSRLTASRTSSMRSQLSESGNSHIEDNEPEAAASRPRVSQSLLLASQTSTPKLTPPGSPPSVSASVSPSQSSRQPSPRRHSISFSTTRGLFDDRSSVFSMPTTQYSSMPGYESQPGRTRVDGKERRQVRSRLSYEQFGAFLGNVKDLNSHKQTREETLRKAEEMFGPENKDLYDIFEGLITRNVH
ncbi:hypothetical protein Leryth_020577 [Lithospermum erythrorhizon]|nr:hypothetical protein Leryth_020577 [Lithospermum erythrorhizon]